MRCLATIVLAGLVALPSWAQPDPDRPPPPQARDDRPPRGNRPPPMDEAATVAVIKARLERRLTDTRQLAEQIAAAIKRLDDGEPPREVMRDLEPIARAFRPPAGPRAAGRNGPPDDAPPAAKTLAFLDEHFPDLAQRLRNLRRDNPAAAERMLARIRTEVGPVAELKDVDPQFAQLRIQEMRTGYRILQAAEEHRRLLNTNAPQPQLDASTATIREAIAAQFDAVAAIHAHDINQLKLRLAELEQKVLNNNNARDTMIDDKTQQILRSIDRRENIRPR